MDEFLKLLEDSSQKYKQKLDALLEESKGLVCGGNYDEHQLKLNAAIATELEMIISDYELLISRYEELPKL